MVSVAIGNGAFGQVNWSGSFGQGQLVRSIGQVNWSASQLVRIFPFKRLFEASKKITVTDEKTAK
jgi:hypothetical protein